MIDNGLKTIKHVFDGSKKFRIPEYQRAFAWEKKHIDEFFYDIFYQTSQQKYFYGTILLNEADDEGQFSVSEIVDGQQRITTLVIFVSVLLRVIRSLDSKRDTKLSEEIFIKYHGIVKLVVNNLDNSFFQTYIIDRDDDDDDESLTIDTPSQRRLLFAKNRFEELIKEENLGLEKCIDMLRVIERAELLIYSVADSAEATLIFETTNDRGKRLTNLEKLKSFMMYKCILANQQHSPDVVHNLYDRFGKIYQIVEQLGPLFRHQKIMEVEEDQLCQYHFICHYGWGVKKDYQNYLDILKEHINEILRSNRLKEALAFIDEYSISLLEYFNTFKQMLQHENTHLKEVFYLTRVAVFYPVLLKAFYLDKTVDKREFSEVARLAAAFSFRVLGLKFKRTNDVDVFFNAEARDFAGKFKGLLLSINNKISEGAPTRRFRESMLKTGFYHEYQTPTRNYFFWRYENYLRMGQPKMPALRIDDLLIENESLRPTIEHIESIASDWDGKMSRKERDYFNEQCLDSIGNLVLDPKGSNSSKGKKKWKIKEDEYYSQTPLKSQLELKNYLDRKKKNWTRNSVARRTQALIRFIEEPNAFEL